MSAPGTSPAPPSPPRWPRALLRAVLPCHATRGAIFGDLHEEFVRDVADVGSIRARARDRQRIAGILVHAIWDTFRLRTWASAPAPEGPRDADGSPNPARPSIRERAPITGRSLGSIALGLGVLAIGIVVNTSAFVSAEHGMTTPATPAVAHAGVSMSATAIGFAVLGGLSMLACAIVAAHVICRGPTWRRGSRAGRPTA